MKERANNSPKSLCPYCTASFHTFDALKAHIMAEHKSEPAPAPEGVIRLTVNKEDHTLLVEPEWTLYYVIHDVLGLIGAKLFCDQGVCGACTVIMEGRPVLSCTTLAIECDGKHVETVEGIATADHPLIEQYVKHSAMQCGYCTPGFVVTAKALLDRNPNPTLSEVREALAGNLCRCGTYPQHPKAVLEAAEKLKEVGEDVERADATQSPSIQRQYWKPPQR